MNKKAMSRVVWVSVFIALVTAFVFFTNNANEGNNITGATATLGKGLEGQTKCLQPSSALKWIQEKGCERIFEDPKCAEKGFVEIKC